ncbi:calmodulin-like protein 5 [Halyomorpha halys]|uniref:calmodulin-like protein 5 n=1 Tax=Halyomorpha halys TaxID=286706 RepID=UPI0006D51436|nr:calmodulin-like protein 5 isoform X2 [Halyomorpha halys]
MASSLRLPSHFMRFNRRNLFESCRLMNIGTAIRSSHTERGIRQYRSEDLRKMKDNFILVNKDVLGKLNAAEFNSFISLSAGRRWSCQDLNMLFRQLDTNRDEYVSFSDIMDHLNKVRYEQTNETLAYAFCKFDKDSDHYISLHELKEALFYLGFFQAGSRKVEQFFRARDRDNDGRISYSEFSAIVKDDMSEFFPRMKPKELPKSRISCKQRCRLKKKEDPPVSF